MKLFSLASLFLLLALAFAHDVDVDMGEEEDLSDIDLGEVDRLLMEQPISSEDALCRYIQKLSKMKRVYFRFEDQLPKSAIVKINGAINQAKSGSISGSMDRLFAAVKDAEAKASESEASAEMGKVGGRQARNLAITIIKLSKDVVVQSIMTKAKRQLAQSIQLFDSKQYMRAVEFSRKAVRTIVFSNKFPSKKLAAPKCPPIILKKKKTEEGNY